MGCQESFEDKRVVHIYYDKTGHRDWALAVINNSKTWRVGADYALDCLLVNYARLFDISIVFNPLADAQMVVYADERAMKHLQGRYPLDLLKPADEKSYSTKFLNNELAVKTVDTHEEALEHISQYGSRNCQGIISEDEEHIELFINHVDADAVFVNASTAFSDGSMLRSGTRKDIKMHDSEKLKVSELASNKVVIRGSGHVRKYFQSLL
jgi:glutamate-5-semialdehyde dehydrogenase